MAQTCSSTSYIVKGITYAHQDVQAIKHFPEHNMLAIALRRSCQCQENLAGIAASQHKMGVSASASSGQLIELIDAEPPDRARSTLHVHLFLPEFAMLSTPGPSCLSFNPGFSSLNLPP